MNGRVGRQVRRKAGREGDWFNGKTDGGWLGGYLSGMLDIWDSRWMVDYGGME